RPPLTSAKHVSGLQRGFRGVQLDHLWKKPNAGSVLELAGPQEKPARIERAMPPTLSNGKICYIEMPAPDIARSAEFYKRVFGWNVRRRGDGSTAFDDTVGEVSGAWVLGRPPAGQPGLLFYVMVESVEATLNGIVANGGEIVQPIGVDAPEIT